MFYFPTDLPPLGLCQQAHSIGAVLSPPHRSPINSVATFGAFPISFFFIPAATQRRFFKLRQESNEALRTIFINRPKHHVARDDCNMAVITRICVYRTCNVWRGNMEYVIDVSYEEMRKSIRGTSVYVINIAKLLLLKLL